MPNDITGKELDRGVRAALRGLAEANAVIVAQHLVAAGRFVDEDPELALRHAMAAQRRAGRIAVVREAAGVTAYLAGRYTEALAELRAARRMSGSADHLPMMADCERGLGRPQRALELAKSSEGEALDTAGRIEMRIVAAGARRDLGQAEAAVLTLQVPELRSRGAQPWSARLRFAYADALLEVGRREEAREWFARAVEVDEDAQTGAQDRLDALDGVTFLDEDDDDQGDAGVHDDEQDATDLAGSGTGTGPGTGTGQADEVSGTGTAGYAREDAATVARVQDPFLPVEPPGRRDEARTTTES